MSPDELSRLRFGTTEPRPAVTALTAGALTADLVEGGLRAIWWHGVEVIRAIAYVVRDRDWGTYTPHLHGLMVQLDEAGFAVAFEARCGDGPVLTSRVSIAGRPDGTLVFDVEAVPDEAFETNRCGFAVLHPILGLAGRPVRIEHVDGRVEDSAWPDMIEPWQPFKDIRAIIHAVAPGLLATCRLDGDTFEMEDQRNWSDASYKTYVRPLALPWPYTLPAGIPQRQTVTVTLAGDAAAARPASAETATAITLGAPAGHMPRIGLLITPEEAGAVLGRRDRLAEAAPQILLLHHDPVAGHAAEALGRLAAVRDLLPGAEAVLECVVPGERDPADELRAIAADVRDAGLRLDGIAVCPAADRQSTPPGSRWPDCPPLEQVYAAARAAFPGLPLTGGMVSYFTELNRKRPPVALLDAVTHAICPIVHAADDASVMESLEALPFMVRSVRAMVGAMPYRIGPSTIGMRQNPYGSRTFANPDNRRLTMTHDDPRQRGLLAAAWMIGLVAATADGAPDAITVAALTGAFGLLGDHDTVHPAFHAARGLAALAGAPRLSCRSSRPDSVLGIAARHSGGPVLWLANISDRAEAVTVPEAFRRARILDQTSWDAAMRGAAPPSLALAPGALVLEPYAVACLEQ